MAVLGAAAGFRDVREWYTRIAILSDQVCLIEDVQAGRPRGTAFLVGRDLVLTAAHVVDARYAPFTSLMARFDFIMSTESGELSPGNRYALASAPMLASSPPDDLDLALIKLADPIGERSAHEDQFLRGWVDLASANLEPVPGTAIAIFQHPEGGPLKVAMSTNSVVRYEESLKRLLYRTDTAPGSSGGPCFDIDWRFVAMHTAHAFQLGNFNMGVPVKMIIDWLRSNGHGQIVDQKPPVQMKAVVRVSTAPPHGTFGIDAELRKLLFGPGEGQRLELKARATDSKVKNAKISGRLLKTVAAFMNSREGGSILIGVSNDRQFVGVESEYTLVNQQRADWDGYAMWLNSVVAASLDVRAAFNYFSIVRFTEDKKDVCAVHVQPAEMPVFLDGVFYVRSGSQNTPLSGHDMLAYIASRWSWLGTRSLQGRADNTPSIE
jgi:V8-like Glu-specific endopeptidase